ncbi:MAG: response regulator [Candidatus Wallbacteria bacterium]
MHESAVKENIKGRILIIDDDEAILRVLSKFLELEGHKVTSVLKSVDALEVFKKNVFDLVITDMYMPEMDGLDVIRNFKDVNMNVPIIILTAAGTISNVIQSLKLGAFNYMTKPFNINEVREIVNKALLTSFIHQSQKGFISFLTQSYSKFRVPSLIDYLNPVVFYINHLVDFFGFKSLWQIQLAVTEAFTNAVVHGNKNDQSKNVEIELLFEKDLVKISILDEGTGFKIPDLKEYKLNDDIYASSGRGIFLMNSYMDELLFNDKGNRITMIKRRDSE